MPQPTLDEVMVALRNADKAGNTEDATKLAAIAKQLSDEQSAQEEAQKPSMLEKTTEAVFGKGTPEETGFGERVKKIAETGLTAGLLTGAAKMASPAMITGGEMIARLPGTPAKFAGGAMIAGGELAKGITPQAVIGATGAGVGGESLEQMASAMGADRPTQVALGFAGAPVGQMLTEYPGRVLSGITNLVSKPITSMFSDLLKSTAEDTATRLRKEAVGKAVDELKSGATKNASITLDKALKGGVTERQKAVEADRLLQEAKVKQEIAKRQQIQQQQQAVQQKPITIAPDEETFSSQLQGDIYSTQKPLLDARTKSYNENYAAGVQSAEAKEATGNFWQNTEGGQNVKAYWENKIDNRKLGPDSEKAVEKVLNDVYGKTGDNPRSITGIDEIIRMLGDKASRDSAGYGAIGDKLAGDLRRSITQGSVKDVGDEEAKKIGNGLYDWEPRFGQAKKDYAQLTKDLEVFETKTGKKTLGEETKPLEVPKQYFNSRAGYEDLIKQLGGDEKKAAEYAKQYAQLKTQDLTTSKELNNWLKDPKNGWIDRVLGLRNQIEQKSVAGAKSEELGKQIPVLEKNLVEWNKNVDTKAQKLYTDIMSSDKPGYTFENMLLSKKLSDTESKALFTYIAKNPESRKLVPSVVKNLLADESPKNIVNTLDKKIAPVLEISGLMSKKDIQDIRLQARKIYEADVKDYNIPKSKKPIKAMNFLTSAIAARIGSEVTPTPKGEVTVEGYTGEE
jgi:hypothetical protein